MPAGEGFGFGEIGRCFDRRAEHETDAQAGLLGGGTQEPVVADAGKSLGQDVEEPAAEELVGMEAEHPGVAAVAGGPAQEDAALRVVSDEAFGVVGNGRDDDVDVRVMLHLASPGVQDAGETGPCALGLGGEDSRRNTPGSAWPRAPAPREPGVAQNKEGAVLVLQHQSVDPREIPRAADHRRSSVAQADGADDQVTRRIEQVLHSSAIRGQLY